MTTALDSGFKVAIIGPHASWETDEAISDLVAGLEEQDVRTIVLNDQGGDPHFTALRDHLRANRMGGLAVVNYSYRYEEELSLALDLNVTEAARKTAGALLPIFLNVPPTMGGLNLEGLEGPQPELVVFGNSIEVITSRLELGAGVK